MPHSPYIDILLMLIGFAGFCVASYIYHRKHMQRPVVCPMNGHCDEVTGSGYSKFLGMSVERLGMVYYMTVFLFHALVLVNPAILNPVTLVASLAAVALAMLFSLYLVALQAFVLREWCTWCISSAIICAAIFITTFMSLPAGLL